MKRTIIIISALFFNISILMSQTIIEARYNQARESARISYAQRNFAQAIRYYEAALDIRPESATHINDRIRHINNRITAEREAVARVAAEREQNYQNARAAAQQNLAEGQYALALHYYHRARDFRPESAAHIDTRIAYINNRIIDRRNRDDADRRAREYQEAILLAQRFYAERQLYQARQQYQIALGIKPENAVELGARIRAINEELNRPAELRIYRPRLTVEGFVTGRSNVSIIPVRFDILLDNTVVGQRTTNNWRTTVPITTFGVKTLSAAIDGRRAELQINFQPGGIYYVRVGYSSQSVAGTRNVRQPDGSTRTEPTTTTQHTPTLQLIDRSIGSAEFNAVGTGRNRR